ncbi:phosphotransferase [Actinophytocola xinjiangensis]|uniref:phosphotransferase n=1 Tax=Actinophytocola xinjiangensis TaxID=485602 RepID=UPI000A85E76B|nr:phosphotransferase [Actinophytocola xinjiangensis]
MSPDVAWLDRQLTAAGRTRTGPVTEVRRRPWSSVYSAPTDHGTVWLKATGAGSAFEAGLHALIARVCPGDVPVPIAVDAARGWLLLPDGGPTITGSVLTGLVEILPKYALLQRKLTSHVDEMLTLGLTDMRPAAMPARLDEAIDAARRRGGGDGLAEIRALRPRFTRWCARLAESPVPASVDHNDLHPNSVFAAGPRLFDWGDAVVAHPFASALVALQAAEGPDLVRLRDAYLEPFTDLAPHADLVGDLELACRVAKPARALVWDRALPRDESGPLAQAPRRTLLALLDRNWLALSH